MSLDFAPPRPLKETKQYVIRPLSKPPRTDLKDAFRIYLSPTSLSYHHLKAGEVCEIRAEGKQNQAAIAWTAPEKIQDSVVQTSKILQTVYGLKLGDKVSLHRREDRIPGATVLTIEVVDPTKEAVQQLSLPDIAGWEWFLAHTFSTFCF
jgi:AAA family ATPase